MLKEGEGKRAGGREVGEVGGGGGGGLGEKKTSKESNQTAKYNNESNEELFLKVFSKKSKTQRLLLSNW